MTVTAAFQYLGPAEVVSTTPDGSLRLITPDGPIFAEMALSFPYLPEPGDRVLVIGGDSHYVIGVLKGRGMTRIHIPGNLELRADGRVDIVGGSAVELQSPRIILRADRLESITRVVVQRCVDAYHWIEGVLQLTAGRARTVIKGHSTLHAERIIQKAKKTVTIDGEQINLG